MSWRPRNQGRGRPPAGLVGSVAVFVVTLVLAGCGGADAPARTLRLDAAADGSLRFERESVTASAHRTSVEMANPSAIPHAIAIRGQGLEESGATVGKDGVSRLDADLEAGTYTLFCPVAGHEEAGMTARLTVR
jgi:plastocyanin